MKKIVVSLVLILIIITSFQAFSYAAGSDLDSIKDGMKDANKYNSGDASGSFGKALNTIIGIIQFSGSGIAIIVVSILGIKYLMTSPSEKAEVKKQAMPVVIGCALLFGAVNIADIIYKFATDAFE